MDLSWFADFIGTFIARYPYTHNTAAIWQEPLLACARADDPEFMQLKQAVGQNHKLPGDMLPGARTVVVYFIPFSSDIIKSNIPDKKASREWAITYIETNRLIIELNQHIYEELAKKGYACSRIPPTHNFDPEKLISDWSHRHVACIAGLGTLGYNNMLITEKGCCGRIGSFVTNVEIEPTTRPAQENCLYKRYGTCRACVKRCVNQALKEDGFDRHRCYEMCLFNEQLHSDLGKADVCGKCLVGVPCSIKIPKKLKPEA